MEQEKQTGKIMSTNKYINIFAAVLMAIVVVLTAVVTGYSKNEDFVEAFSYNAECSYEDLFDAYEVMEIEVSMAEEDFEAMLENPTAEEYKQCNITVNGETYANVAIRTKGNTSLSQVASSDSDRYSFKVEFDHYDSGQSLEGLDKLVLNNLFCDATYIKEYIAYDIFNYIGVACPYYSFAHITINGEEWGLYLALEAMEDSFVERVYGSTEGELYKPESMSMGGGMPGNGEMTQRGGGFRKGEKSQKDGQPEGIEKPDGTESSVMNETSEKMEKPDDTESTEMSEVSEEMEKTDGTKSSGMNEMPEGMKMPEMGELPEGMEMPEMGELPEGMEMPEIGELPEGMEMPEMGEAPEGMEMPEMGELPEGMESPEMGKGSGMFGSSGGGSDLVYTDDSLESYADIFDNAAFSPTDEEKEAVIEALKNLSEGENLEQFFDVDACLRYFAAQTFIVNMDSYYSSLKHNYYLYEQEGQLTILPWDLNLAFGGFQASGATDAVNSAIDTPMGGSLEESRPLFSKLMEVEEYKELYHQYLNEIVTGYVGNGQFSKNFKTITTVIDAYVQKDATAFYGYDEYKEAIENLQQFVLLRAASVEGQLNGTIPATTEEQKNCDTLIDASSVDLSTMGTQGGDGAGGKGSQGGRMFGNTGNFGRGERMEPPDEKGQSEKKEQSEEKE